MAGALNIAHVDHSHESELSEHDFWGCCKNCRKSLSIIKPRIMAFSERIKHYSPETLRALPLSDLFQLYRLLDDLSNMNVGSNLAGLILDEPDIRRELPAIRSYYSVFFNIHEVHLAEELLISDDPWKRLEDFPLYSRYKALVKNQMDAMHIDPDMRLVFIGCGPVPISLILMSRMYRIRSIGMDSNSESVDLSRKVIRRLGLDKSIEIVLGDDLHLSGMEWDMALIAALAEPKARIFRNLLTALQGKRTSAPVVFRTYTGMKAVLYKPVQPEDIDGFQIVKTVPPTGDVNNTIVFLRSK